MVTKMVRRPQVIQLLPPHEQLEELLLAPNDDARWERKMVEIVLESGFKFIGTISRVSETHVVTDFGVARKDRVEYVRVMKDEEVRIRKGLNPW
jgi:hypothetical protein